MHPRIRQHQKTVEQSLTRLAEELEGWVQEAARDGDGRPLAAVVDIDEVLLCGACRPRGTKHEDHLRLPMPTYRGAKALMAGLRRLKVLPVLITGRRESTVANLRAEGIITAGEERKMGVSGNVAPQSGPPRLFMRPCAELALRCPSPGPWKMRMRRRLAETHRILLSVGDQESDFVPDPERFRVDALHEWRVPNPFYTIK